MNLTLKKRRKYWLNVHLWLGLLFGFFLSIFGITGSILVFYEEINALINPDVMTVSALPEAESAFRPFEEIFTIATTSLSTQAKVTFIHYPSDASSAYTVGYTLPNTDNKVDVWQLHIDPYHSQILGQRLIKKADAIFPSAVMPFIFQLHFALLAGETGGVIVGIMAVLLLFSILTGLIVWWPLTDNWRRALRIKPRASIERFNHDLHQTSGIYTGLILLVVLLSGIYMNLPNQFIGLVKQLSPDTHGFMDRPHSVPANGQTPIGLVRALQSVRSQYPDGRVNWLNPAVDETDVYRISLRDVPELSYFWSERLVSVDQYTGKILEVSDPSTRRTAGETFIAWQWSLHSGKAFGWIGRILVFLSGLACPVLFVTGVIRWLQKRRAAKTKQSLVMSMPKKK